MRKYFFFISIIIMACNEPDKIQEFGFLHVSLGLAESQTTALANARTVHPLLDSATYTLHFTYEGNGISQNDLAIVPNSVETLSLVTGNWTIEALGTYGDTLESKGVSTVTIQAGQHTSLSITMKPVEEGKGKLNYLITLAPDTSATLTISPPRQDIVNASVNLAAGTNNDEIELTPGVYLITIDAQPEGTSDYADLVDILHIYKNRTTSFTYDPAGLSTEGTLIDKLDLSDKIKAPETGNSSASYTFNANGQYTGSLSWQNSDGSSVNGNFSSGTVYQAVITLTPANTYTLDGLDAASFTYPGATSVTYDPDKKQILIVFPQTSGTASTNNIDISLSYFYEDIPIAGNDGQNILRKAGSPNSVIFTAPAGYNNIAWYVGVTKVATGTTLEINAKTYDVGTYFITFTGRRNTDSGSVYSQVFPLTIEKGFVTYTAEQLEGAEGIASSKGIKLTFSEAISGLTSDEVQITNGTGEVIKGSLTGQDTEWIQWFTSVKEGTILLALHREGIESTVQSIKVYMHEESPRISRMGAKVFDYIRGNS